MGYAVATPHALATRAGADAMGAGGSAVDGALAAAAVLTVAYPHMCALGGDMFALVRSPAGDVVSVNGCGPAAAAADPDAMSAIPASGPLTVTVPGVVGGWGALHAAGARTSWASAFAPAIGLARDGVAIAPGLADAFAGAPAMARALGADGDALRQPALAATLEAIARDGADAFYRGPVADALVGGLRDAGCLLTADDLAAYAPRVDAPLRGRFGELEVLTSPPNSAGELLLDALAAIDAGEDVEAVLNRHTFAERHLSTTPGNSDDARRDGGDTVALVTADDEGWAVSLIQSVFSSFGAQIVEPATGVLVHNRGACFVLERGHPNRLAPGKRPMHTLMPAMALTRGGALAGVLGTMGGFFHAPILAQVLLALRAGRTPQEAVDAPRSVGDFGHAQAIWALGGLRAGSDRRADGEAIVVA